MMKGPLRAINRSEGIPVPQWYEVVNQVHADDTEAPQFEHKETGELVRVVKFQDLQCKEMQTSQLLNVCLLS